jgi:hypothetical protein
VDSCKGQRCEILQPRVGFGHNLLTSTTYSIAITPAQPCLLRDFGIYAVSSFSIQDGSGRAKSYANAYTDTCIVQICIKHNQGQGTSAGHSDDYPPTWADGSGYLLRDLPAAAAAIFFSAANLRELVCTMDHHLLRVWTRSIDETMCSLSQFPCTTWESR